MSDSIFFQAPNTKIDEISLDPLRAVLAQVLSGGRNLDNCLKLGICKCDLTVNHNEILYNACVNKHSSLVIALFTKCNFTKYELASLNYRAFYALLENDDLRTIMFLLENGHLRIWPLIKYHPLIIKKLCYHKSFNVLHYLWSMGVLRRITTSDATITKALIDNIIENYKVDPINGHNYMLFVCRHITLTNMVNYI